MRMGRWAAVCILLIGIAGSGSTLAQHGFATQPAFHITTYYHGKQLWEIPLPAYGPTLIMLPGDVTSAHLMHIYVFDRGTELTAADGTSIIAPRDGTTPPVGVEAVVKWDPKGSDCFHASVRVTVLTGFNNSPQKGNDNGPAQVATATFNGVVVIPMRGKRTLVDDPDGVGIQLTRYDGSISPWSHADISSARKKCQP